MLKFETPSGTGEVENCWEDLSPIQFIETVDLTNRFLSGEFTLEEYRLRLLEMLTGYKRKRKPATRNPQPETIETINENLFLISEQLNFAIRPKVGPDEVLEFFTPELREALKTRFPWEIHEPELLDQLLRMKNQMEVQYDLNFNIVRNPLKYLKFGTTVLEGPVFEATADELTTTLKAGEYLDAHEYFRAFSQNRDKKYLDRMILCLYHPIEDPLGEPVEPDFADEKVKNAIAFVFLFIEQTLVNDPVFSILYQHNDKEYRVSPKLDIGPDAAIGQLVSAGFGSHDAIVNLDIRTFFNYQVLLIKRNVETLRGYGKKANEIAKELNLPIETVQKL